MFQYITTCARQAEGTSVNYCTCTWPVRIHTAQWQRDQNSLEQSKVSTGFLLSDGSLRLMIS